MVKVILLSPIGISIRRVTSTRATLPIAGLYTTDCPHLGAEIRRWTQQQPTENEGKSYFITS